MTRPRLQPFGASTFLVASAIIALLLLAVVLAPQILARDARLQVLRKDLDQFARVAASQVDGDLHRRLIESGALDEATRRQALAPLLRLHESWPEAMYVYTMGVKDGKPYFILDTAQDATLAQRRGLKASKFMEAFELRDEYSSDWLDQLAAGHTYINPGFQYDDYGYFLSGHAPIRDSAGNFAGFVGVDFDLNYYMSEEERFRRIEFASVVCVLLLSLLLGLLYARYRHAQQAELVQHYETSMHDELTGLPNRRGALAAIDELCHEGDLASHAALLVDVDNFKTINDTHGHAAGDEVLKRLAGALHGSLRPGDITARLGGDEFLIFARDCDEVGAAQIASRLLAAVRAESDPVPFSVSIGIGIGAASKGGFDLLYRQADHAMYRAKEEGRNRFEVFALA